MQQANDGVHQINCQTECGKNQYNDKETDEFSAFRAIATEFFHKAEP